MKQYLEIAQVALTLFQSVMNTLAKYHAQANGGPGTDPNTHADTLARLHVASDVVREVAK